MAKFRIGHFKYGTSYEYSIYANKLYKQYNDWIEIGNASFGRFMKFKMNSNEIVLHNPRVKYVNSKAGVKLCVGRAVNDVEYYLKALFEARGLELLELDLKSREEIEDKIIIDKI